MRRTWWLPGAEARQRQNAQRLVHLPLRVYEALYRTALQRDRGLTREEMLGVLARGLVKGRLVGEAGMLVQDEVFTNRGPAEYYRVLWRLAVRRDSGVTADQAIVALRDQKNATNDRYGKAAIRLVWGME